MVGVGEGGAGLDVGVGGMGVGVDVGGNGVEVRVGGNSVEVGVGYRILSLYQPNPKTSKPTRIMTIDDQSRMTKPDNLLRIGNRTIGPDS